MVATRNSNWTTGKIYLSVIQQRAARRLPRRAPCRSFRTSPTRSRTASARSADDVDVVLVEIGGTVGDIESLPFLEAIRQFRQDVGRENTLYIHLTLVPYIGTAGELKTKPTQHSVRDLRSIGIQPDVLLCRTDRLPRRRTSSARSPCSATSTRKRSSPPGTSRQHLRGAARARGRRASISIVLQAAGPAPHRPATGASVGRPGRAHQESRTTSVTIHVVGKYVGLRGFLQEPATRRSYTAGSQAPAEA